MVIWQNTAPASLAGVSRIVVVGTLRAPAVRVTPRRRVVPEVFAQADLAPGRTLDSIRADLGLKARLLPGTGELYFIEFYDTDGAHAAFVACRLRHPFNPDCIEGVE